MPDAGEREKTTSNVLRELCSLAKPKSLTLPDRSDGMSCDRQNTDQGAGTQDFSGEHAYYIAEPLSSSMHDMQASRPLDEGRERPALLPSFCR